MSEVLQQAQPAGISTKDDAIAAQKAELQAAMDRLDAIAKDPAQAAPADVTALLSRPSPALIKTTVHGPEGIARDFYKAVYAWAARHGDTADKGLDPTDELFGLGDGTTTTFPYTASADEMFAAFFASWPKE